MVRQAIRDWPERILENRGGAPDARGIGANSSVQPRPGAIILAGGRSTRLGRDKATVAFAGRPLIQRVVSRLAPACDPIVVVHAPGQTLPPLAGATMVPDPPGRAGEGPLAGVVTGLEALAHRGVALAFLGGCDAPFVSAAHVGALVVALEPDASSVLVDDGVRRQFLSSVVRVDPVLVVARDLLAAGTRSLRALFDAVSPRLIPVAALPDQLAVRTFNTPGELEALERLEVGS